MRVPLWVASGFDQLTDDPRRQGWAWDLTTLNGGGYQPVTRPITDQLLRAAGAGRVVLREFRLVALHGDVELPTFGLEPGDGAVDFTMLDGRMPTSAGREVSTRKHQRPWNRWTRFGGKSVFVLDGGQALREAVLVGRVILLLWHRSTLLDPDPGTGAVMTQLGLEALVGPVEPTAVIIEARPGDADGLEQRMVDRLPGDRSLDLFARINRLARCRAWTDELEPTPIIAIGVVTLLLGGVLVHSLALTRASARQEVAVIRALGLTPRQTRSILLGQSVWMTAAALAIGVPLGAIAGVALRSRMAHGYDVDQRPPCAHRPRSEPRRLSRWPSPSSPPGGRAAAWPAP